MSLKRLFGELLLAVLVIFGLNFFLGSPIFKNGLESLEYNLQANDFYSQFFSFSGIKSTAVNSSVAAVASKVSPAVVSIYGNENAGSVLRRGDFFARASAGSGFFVDPSGYILTNNHVVNSPDFNYFVELSDGSKLPATIVFQDAAQDLAIVKVPGDNFPVLNLGDSAKIQVGQAVAGIGNAYGFATNTISAGRISGLNKAIIASDDQGDEHLDGLIRSTAQLYPGDSGGPLFDMNGNVVGIDVATSTDQDNVSFSIPINAAKTELSNIVGHS